MLLSTALLHVTGTIDPGDPLPELSLGAIPVSCSRILGMVIRFHAPLLCVDGETFTQYGLFDGLLSLLFSCFVDVIQRIGYTLPDVNHHGQRKGPHHGFRSRT